MPINSNIPETPSDEYYAIDQDQGEVFTADDPFLLFEDWFKLAVKYEPNDAGAMSLARAGSDGQPDVRIMLMKDFTPAGVTFFSSRLSAKGLEMAENKQAAICFHWKSIRRQVRFRGRVEIIPGDVATAYFQSRARGAQIGAWASSQSQPIENPDALKHEVKRLEIEYSEKEIPRPDYWTGFRVVPSEIEFWVNKPFRLHDRRKFSRISPSAKWESCWLNP